MTLKTTKEQRDELLANNRALLPYAQVSITLQMVHNLCHDADRAGEMEKELETGRKAWKVLQQKNDDLRAKLDRAYDRAAEELEKAFNEADTLNLLHGAARVRALKEQEKP